MEEYGIIYHNIKLNDQTYLFIPITIVEGYSVGEDFFNEQIHKIALDSETIQSNEFVVDEIHRLEDLQFMYDDYELDCDFMRDFFLEDEKDYIIICEINGSKVTKRKIKFEEFKNGKEYEIYDFTHEKPVLILNNESLNSLLNCQTIEEVRTKIARYKTSLGSLTEDQAEYVTRVTVRDGAVSEIDTNAVVVESTAPQIITHEEEQTAPDVDSAITISGLEAYLNERILGREEQIKGIATTLIMNYTASPEEDTESILILGPSGSGKTKTFEAASEYLDIPYRIVDCASLVPQGIVGTNLSDYLLDLLNSTNGDLAKASKGLIILDEFDKLSQKNPDFRESIINEFLKFSDGTDYIINRRNKSQTFNTRGLSRVHLGVFDFAIDTQHSIGFGQSIENTGTYDLSRLTEGSGFDSQIIDRVSNHIFVYESLSRELKRKIILESKYGLYLKKKQRYLRQFGVEFEMQIDYIDALLDKVTDSVESMRQINSYIMRSLEIAQYEMLSHPTSYKKLILTRDTIDDPQKFILS